MKTDEMIREAMQEYEEGYQKAYKWIPDLCERLQKLEAEKSPVNTTPTPWNHGALREWTIVGMYHYYHHGIRQLHVSMTRNVGFASECIQADGPDESEVWASLLAKAEAASP
jgi:hypothetical protein